LVLRESGLRSSISIDGMELKSVTSVEVKSSVNHPTLTTITMYGRVEVEGDHALKVDESLLGAYCSSCNSKHYIKGGR
jgi:hypothetical protein